MSDIQEVSKLGKVFELEESEVTIGRGPFLGVVDKRVSRNHGTLRRVETGVEVKSIHVNPCFYARCSDPEKWMKLNVNETVVLHNGDLFSLLPKSYIYKVTRGKNSTQNGDENREQNGRDSRSGSPAMQTKGPAKDFQIPAENAEKVADLTTTSQAPNEKEVSPKVTKHEGNPDFSEDDNAAGETDSNLKLESRLTACGSSLTPDTFMDGDKEVAFPLDKKRKLPSWMINCLKKTEQETPSTSTSKTPKKTSKRTVKTPRSSTAKRKQNVKSIKFDSDDEEEAKESVKKSQQDSRDILRQVEMSEQTAGNATSEFVEMVDASCAAQTTFDAGKTAEKQSLPGSRDETSTESTEKIRSSRGFDDDDSKGAQSDSDGSFPKGASSADQPHVSPAVATNQPSTSRERCGYGSSCYRKNPLHSQEFSHPGDPDYVELDESTDDDTGKPECPYGTNCYRRNPLHKKQYRHSRRMAPKRAARVKAAKRKKQDDETSSDEYDLDDSFLNDETDEDAGKSGDEDWNPSQGSQQTPRSSSRRRNKAARNYAESDSTTDEEDLEDLVADAKKFAKNKKMWK